MGRGAGSSGYSPPTLTGRKPMCGWEKVIYTRGRILIHRYVGKGGGGGGQGGV